MEERNEVEAQCDSKRFQVSIKQSTHAMPGNDSINNISVEKIKSSC
jgi:hypothetical protein